VAIAGKKILFISDAHLGSGSNEPNQEDILLEFIRNLVPERVSTLYILGDLFDFWFEYESVVLSQHFRILTELARAVEQGIEIHLVVGNHDFWTGDFLAEIVGLHIHHAPLEIELDGKRIYICHGDGLNPQDRGYRVLKAVVRNRFVIWMLRWLHPDLTVRIARRFSKLSRESSSVAGKLREDDGIQRFAAKKFSEGVDVVVAAHSHQPHDETCTVDGKPRRYLNTGDMYRWFSYLEYSRGRFELKYLDRE
jgi:UDP-2,3-diacylglucosamine hydrolase